MLHDEHEKCAITSILFTIAKDKRLDNDTDLMTDMFLNAEGIFESHDASIGIASFEACKKVLNDKEFVFNRSNYLLIGPVNSEVVLFIDRSYVPPKKVRNPHPKRRAPFIHELLRNKAESAYYVIQPVEMDNALSYYIALMVEDGKAVFVDSAIPFFVEATKDTFRLLGFKSIWKCWKMKWAYPTEQQMMHERAKGEKRVKRIEM